MGRTLSLRPRKSSEITGIKQIRTSPYHPQTDAMVEQFNATLKRMLKKHTQSPGAQWDKCSPYMWVYRGTTHKTTGFSPYHLLFGRPMRMPLDQIVSYWQGKEERNECSTTEYIATLKVNLKLVRNMANGREIKKKERQKVYHEWKSVVREFSVGDYVLVFRPIRKGKLENQWQGPFIITKKTMLHTKLI